MRPDRALAALLAAVTASFTPLVAEAGQVSILVNYAGAGCVVCGVADYAFPGSELWNDGNATFSDPIPAGAVAVQMTASSQGICDSDASVLVDGTLIGTTSILGSTCACDLCANGSLATSAVQDGGWPGYVYGGTNTLQIQTVSTGVYDGINLTIIYRLCGDGAVDPGEACDTAGATATCDADCTPVACGDGQVNAAAGETCDASVENPACDSDCTLAECGDDHVNASAGEACDDGNTDGGDGCSAVCQTESGPSAGSGGAGGAGEGGAGSNVGGGDTSGAGGDGGAGPTGPTGSGIAVAIGAGPGGGDDDDDGDDGGVASDGSGSEGTGGDAAGASGGESGCGCAVPRRAPVPSSFFVAGFAFVGAVIHRVRKRRASGFRARG